MSSNMMVHRTSEEAVELRRVYKEEICEQIEEQVARAEKLLTKLTESEVNIRHEKPTDDDGMHVVKLTMLCDSMERHKIVVKDMVDELRYVFDYN